MTVQVMKVISYLMRCNRSTDYRKLVFRGKTWKSWDTGGNPSGKIPILTAQIDLYF